MVTETDIELPDGRTLHVYDTPADGDSLAVFWHHGTPNTGEPPEPLLAEPGIRWVSHDRPSYGGSTPLPGRDIASAAADVAAVADALGIERFAVMGHSGGGPHALACGALLPERVLAVVSVSGLAPLGAEGLDWFADMAAPGELHAAIEGREAMEHFLASNEWDPEQFTPADHAALEGAWGWLGAIAGKAMQDGPAGMVADQLAYVAPWGFDPAQVSAPVLLVHGDQDRVVPSSHSQWLARHGRTTDLWLRPGEGHISVLSSGVAALAWLREQAADPKSP